MSLPDAVILHTVMEAPWIDAWELRDRIEDCLPDVAIHVARTWEESLTTLDEAPIALGSIVPAELVDDVDTLEWLQATSSGVNDIDTEPLREKGVYLTTASGVHAEPIAEQVLGYMLAFERGLIESIERKRRTTWERDPGGELKGKVLGIIGVGAIGKRVAQFGQALGMTVLGTRRKPRKTVDGVDELRGPDGLVDLLEQSDYVVVACPLNERTEGMLHTSELGVMKRSAILINVARGAIVNEDALVRALQHRQIGGAALDVFTEEPLPPDSLLWDLPNVIITPHTACSSPHKIERIAAVFATNYGAFSCGDADDMENRVF